MKRKIVAVLCITLGIFALSGCGSTKQTEETQKTEEMELYIFNSKGEISDSLEELVEDYEKESGVKVKLFIPRQKD